MQFHFHGRPKPEVRANLPADLMEKVQGDWKLASQLYETGVFRQIWTAGPGVVAICEANSQAELEALLAELPLNKAGYINFDVTELKPYRGFGPKSAP